MGIGSDGGKTNLDQSLPSGKDWSKVASMKIGEGERKSFIFDTVSKKCTVSAKDDGISKMKVDGSSLLCFQKTREDDLKVDTFVFGDKQWASKSRDFDLAVFNREGQMQDHISVDTNADLTTALKRLEISNPTAVDDCDVQCPSNKL
jgi:hypothetical protein